MSYSLFFSSFLFLTSNSLTRFAAKSIIKSIANSSIFDSLVNSLNTRVASIKNFAYIIFATTNEDKKKKEEKDKKIINKKKKKRDKEKKDIRGNKN